MLSLPTRGKNKVQKWNNNNNNKNGNKNINANNSKKKLSHSSKTDVLLQSRQTNQFASKFN